MRTAKKSKEKLEGAALELGREMGRMLADLGRGSGMGKPEISNRTDGVPNGPLFTLMRKGLIEGYKEG